MNFKVKVEISVYNTRISCSAVMRYTRALKLGCSPAGDGIESEHLKYGIETQIPNAYLKYVIFMYTI